MLPSSSLSFQSVGLQMWLPCPAYYMKHFNILHILYWIIPISCPSDSNSFMLMTLVLSRFRFWDHVWKLGCYLRALWGLGWGDELQKSTQSEVTWDHTDVISLYRVFQNMWPMPPEAACSPPVSQWAFWHTNSSPRTVFPRDPPKVPKAQWKLRVTARIQQILSHFPEYSPLRINISHRVSACAGLGPGPWGKLCRIC